MSRSADDNGAPEIEIEIEHAGTTFLARSGGRYRLEDSLGNGPTLKLNGHDAIESEMGGWHAISAEKVTGGYLVAWKHDASGLYSAWRTDDQGNYTGNVLGAVRGDDDRLRHLEDDFGHDLNDDRVTGGLHRDIEHAGTIHLTQIGARFYLSDDLGQGETLK
ncbi:MAG: hypothetical protein KGP27_09710, partial [Hyphomicrobiales bacterium]|nr:hypothetical protein [Hyphomicrobiales bacterium]